MEIENKKIILFDMDMTLVDSSIAKQYCKNYKEVQKHISEFSLYEGIKESIDKLAEQHTIYIVSGNVGSTVKKVIQHFNLNITLENVYGYRQGYPMENLARKIKVMQVAIDAILQSLQITKSDLLYIGDEVDDYKACQQNGINFLGCVWGNNELKQISNMNTISHPKDIVEAINAIG